MKVLMIATFGPKVRGISPYADSLYEEMQKGIECKPTKLDYSYLYPSFLSPAENQGGEIVKDSLAINAFSLSSWKKVLLYAEKFDLIHLQYWTFITLPFLLFFVKKIKQCKVKVVITVHNPSPHESIPFLSRLEKRLFSSADELIVHTSKGGKVLAERYLCDNNKINIVPHGVWAFDKAKSSVLQQKQILFFGNFRHYKGVDILIEAWRSIKGQYPNYTLVLAGRRWSGKTFIQKVVALILGANRLNKLIDEIKSKQDPQIDLHEGFIENNFLDQLILQSTVVIFPYRHFESQSGAAARACGLGTPVLVSNVGGLPDLAVDARFVFDAESSEALANILSKVIQISHSNEWEDIKLKQKKIADSLSWGCIAREHILVYQKLLREKYQPVEE